MLKSFLLLIILFFLFQGTASAEYYKWEDENGNINITDYPPPTKSGKNVKVYQPEPESSDVSPSTKNTTQTEPKAAYSRDTNVKPRKSHEVVIYTTSWCPYCKMAREFLKSRNINFTEYDIEKDSEAAERKKRLDSKSGVPFAIINGQKIHGYSQSTYEQALQ